MALMTATKKRLAHHVFFTLHDASATKIQDLKAACHKYLDHHPGVESFAVGVVNPDLDRPVNDRAYHVSLHVVFDSRESHDIYQVAPRHNEFIAEQKSNWSQVRVFDSDLD